MGYHNNEDQLKKCVNDAYRFLNDRARLEHALRIALKGLGADASLQDKIVADVRAADFDSINQLTMRTTITCRDVIQSETLAYQAYKLIDYLSEKQQREKYYRLSTRYNRLLIKARLRYQRRIKLSSRL
jgi:hypothetical protein